VTRVLVWIAVGLIGGAGAVARFAVDGAIARRARTPFPLGTFVVNISGAAALGLLAGVSLHGDALLLAGTGALGSYTTFSTWMLESHRLGEDGELALGVLNVALSLAAGIAAAALGRWIGGLV
jgi:CrcB protein